MAMRRAVAATRHAISPLFAISILLNIFTFQKVSPAVIPDLSGEEFSLSAQAVDGVANFASHWQIYIDVIAGLTRLDPQSMVAHA